ncbi:chromosome segregation protein [Bordetella hinzii]|nr:chromosome segregation protein [Bordetella hinzii]
MRIRKVQISNLRAIADATVEFDDYTCLVGANGAGKSTVLFALNVLFRETDAQGNPLTVLAEEDFHRRDTSRPASVTVWFDQLSAEAQEDFKDYYRNGFLVVTAAATFDQAKGKAEIKQLGQRMAMAEFAEYFGRKGDGAKVAELKELYTGLRAKFPDLNAATTGPAMEDALRTFEAARPDLCTLIPSEDQFYGATKGQGRLQRHIQWVYVPAVKDASTEQAEGKATALGKLLARTVRAKVNFAEGLSELTLAARRSYQQLLDESQEQLSEVSSALNARLAQWAHPEASLRLQWHQDSEKSIRVEDPFARVLLGEG